MQQQEMWMGKWGEEGGLRSRASLVAVHVYIDGDFLLQEHIYVCVSLSRSGVFFSLFLILCFLPKVAHDIPSCV